jgi:hypothetical protein
MSKPYVEKLDKSKYNRPKKTFTEKLSKSEIMSKLEDYKKTTIDKISLGTHVRYFVVDSEGNKLFRMGGQLTKNDGMPQYVILSNGKNSWSVQTSTTIFFKKMSLPEIKQEHEIKILDKDKKIKELLTLIKQLKKNYNIP